MPVTQPNYQPAELYAPAKGTWRIEWYNLHPHTKQLQRIQKTFDINRIKDLDERARVAKGHVELVNAALRTGYNYWIHTVGLKPESDPDTLTVKALIDKVVAIRKIGLKKRSVESYNSYANVFVEWLTENELHKLPAEEFTGMHFQQFMAHKSNIGHGNRNINDYLNFYKTTFDIAVKKKLLKESPLTDITFLPEQESTMFATIGDDELQRIAEALKAYSMEYYLYTKFTANEYIRPYHIAFIKAKDIDYKNDIITTYGNSAKNHRINKKQLLPEMKQLLIQFDYHKLHGETYLFGKNFKPNAVAYPTLSKRSAEIWREIVINGLGINKKMYSLKHTSGTQYINENENVDIAWLQTHMEHSTLAETEAYVGKRKVKKIRTDNVNMIKY